MKKIENRTILKNSKKTDCMIVDIGHDKTSFGVISVKSPSIYYVDKNFVFKNYSKSKTSLMSFFKKAYKNCTRVEQYLYLRGIYKSIFKKDKDIKELEVMFKNIPFKNIL